MYAGVVEPFGGGTNQLRQLLIDDSQRVILRQFGEYGRIPAAENVATFSVAAFPRIFSA